jgi:hypothetical protein
MVFSALALLACASVANAGIVDPAQSYATVGCPDPLADPPRYNIMLVAPGGADSFVFPENYQIDVFVNDSGGNPVEIVASDIYLDNDSTEPCPGGWTADSSTYAPDPGHTTFTYTPRGGVKAPADLPPVNGCKLSYTDVIAVGHTIQLGMPCDDEEPDEFELRFVSPDLNGDGHVTVADFGVFASHFNLPCTNHAWCANLDKTQEEFPDACVRVADFGIFASFFNISDCP